MRPQMVAELPTDVAKWIYEPKLDGYRAIAVQGENEMELFSMEGRRFNERFSQSRRSTEPAHTGWSGARR